jgi:DNA polymerase III epsilon subunit-like protein
MHKEVFVSVDVETAGPAPGRYALLTIGACLVENPSEGFYVELQPDRQEYQPGALEISGLSLNHLNETGAPPQEAMRAFADWLNTLESEGGDLIFVALNAPFDWMFVNDYFHRYLGSNPFGHKALDIKAFYMGLAHVDWLDTSFIDIARYLDKDFHLSHNALSDAQKQADIFHHLLKRSQREHGESDDKTG